MDWLNDHAWAAWLGLAAMFGVAEMFSLDLIFLMLAVGAMGGVVAGAFDAPLALQVLVALGTSLATLTLPRRWWLACTVAPSCASAPAS